MKRNKMNVSNDLDVNTLARTIASDAEMAATRFSDMFRKQPQVFWADRRTAHTDLTDAWAWTLEALRNAICLLPQEDVGDGWDYVAMRDAMFIRLAQYSQELEAVYQFKTEVA